TTAPTAASAIASTANASARMISSPCLDGARRPSCRAAFVRRPEPVRLSSRDEPESSRGRMTGVTRELAHLSDEALVLLAARSQQGALAELYDRFGRPAYGLALRILRDEALAEDAVQEAFLGLWRTAARFVPERGKASTWILTLVHRRAVDLVRREERRRTDALEHATEPQSLDAVEEEAWLRL